MKYRVSFEIKLSTKKLKLIKKENPTTANGLLLMQGILEYCLDKKSTIRKMELERAGNGK